MITRKRIRAEKAAQAFRTRTQDVIVPALVGDGAGNVEVTGRAGWVWVRLNGSSDDVAQALNRSASALVEDAAVDLKRVRRYAASYYEIVSPSDAILYDVIDVTDDAGQGVKKHAAQHIRADGGAGGSDPLDVHARMVVPLRARAQSSPDMTLYAEAGYHAFGYFAGGNSPTFTAPTGAGIASRVDLLYIGSDNALHVLQGTATGYGVSLSYPALPSPCVPIAFVRVDKGATALTEAYIVRDARMLSGISPSVYGLTGLLDTTAHSDTVTGAPIVGDLIYANATPQWTRLAANATATNKFLRSVSAGVPSWQQVDYTDLANVPATFAIATPGSLSVSSTNVAAGNHTHAVTSSSDVSAGTTALLASASGALTLKALGINVTLASVPLHVGGSGEIIRIDSASSPYAAYYNGAGSRVGWFGYGYDLVNFYFTNEVATGTIHFQTNSADALVVAADKSATHYGQTTIDYAGTQLRLKRGASITTFETNASNDSVVAVPNTLFITNAAAPYVSLGTNASTRKGFFGYGFDLNNFDFSNEASGSLKFRTNSNTLQMEITNGGHVLVGTTTDAGKLTVNGEIAIADGMTAPSATSGYAKIYVDTSDGDLKVVFSDGTVKTIVTD